MPIWVTRFVSLIRVRPRMTTQYLVKSLRVEKDFREGTYSPLVGCYAVPAISPAMSVSDLRM